MQWVIQQTWFFSGATKMILNTEWFAAVKAMGEGILIL